MDLIFEDQFIIAVNKPNNMLVHHAKHSRNMIDETSLLQELENNYNKKFYPIHRLDRKTSGIILLAKETNFVNDFQKLFTSNDIQKTYLGIVRGFSPDYKLIDSPVKGRDANKHKEAETTLKTLAKITLNIPVKPYETSRYSLVELTPKTGRLHQLRIHMNKISHPLINDPKYGDKNHNTMFEEHFNLKKLFLHAYTIEFIHPFTNKKLKLKATLPSDWTKLLTNFGWETFV